MSRKQLLEAQSINQQELDEKLDETQDAAEWEKLIFGYLDALMESRKTYVITTKDFDKAGEMWLNCDALKFEEHLQSRLSLLDFFTYCCVNCMHILPHLHEVEEKLVGDDLIVIGVHSAKFDNEKLDENVRNAILRHNIRHPVLNDPEMELWDRCQIVCWPTLMLVGPHGQILYKFIGEKNMDRLIPYLKVFVNYFKGRGDLHNRKPVPVQPLNDVFERNKFSCPSKVAVDGATHSWAVTDSANNRVVVFGEPPCRAAIDVIGMGTPGFKDGSFETAQFSNPQGLCFFDGGLYVADSGNHAIRKVDFAKETVTTIIGTGKQGKDLVGGTVEGTKQEISTPWDLVLYEQNLLLIAMAGSHQIWAYAIEEDVELFKGRVVVKRQTCMCIAGSGREENRNTSYPLRAGFAQPSGLALDDEDDILYIADSESSSIRMLNLRTGAVKNICGGDLDPLELFAFGDADGSGIDVRLQHPLALIWNPLRNKLIVADSYNHKLKLVNPKQRVCLTIPEVRNLKEPGGLAFDAKEGILYVADTENHRVKGLSIKDYKTVLEVGPTFHIMEDESSRDSIDAESRPSPELDFVDYEDGMKVPAKFTLRIDPVLKRGTALTEGAPQTCKLKGNKLNLQWNHPMTVDVPADVDVEGQLECQFVICSEDDKTCVMRKVTRTLKFEQVKEGGNKAVEVTIRIE